MNGQEEIRVFDWDSAAAYIVKNNIKNASAGLLEDWFWTGADILVNGEIVEDLFKPYCASTWATPALYFYDGKNSHYIPFWKFGDETDYDESTYWPETARKILKGERGNE